MPVQVGAFRRSVLVRCPTCGRFFYARVPFVVWRQVCPECGHPFQADCLWDEAFRLMRQERSPLYPDGEVR